MNKKIKILAAVVTHNRKDLLARCVESINAQSRRPDSLVVIDNGSTDGTQDYLKSVGVRSIKQDNLGSAGGWESCIQIAIDEMFDAVWLMDDDGFPDVDALKILENNMKSGVSAVSSIVVNEDNPDRFVFPFPVLNNNKMPKLFSFTRKIKHVKKLKKICNGNSYPFAHFFNGALISASSIQKVGNINRNFFIAGEEVDYFYRLREAGHVVSILTAKHYHPDVSKRYWSKLKFYYFIKNTIILNHKIYKFPYIRDVLTILIALYRVNNRNGTREFLSYIIGRNSNIFYKSILNGFKKRIGKDIDN